MIVAVFVLAVAVCALVYFILKLEKRVETLGAEVISMSMKVSQNFGSISVLKDQYKSMKDYNEHVADKIEELRRQLDSNMEDLDVAKRIEKKWDDAVQRVFDFDPLKSLGGNE